MNPAFFKRNRQNLLAALPDNALVIIAGYGEMQRGHDAAQPFEQEASFWYLTGIEAPDWQAVIDGRTAQLTLIAPPTDDIRQIFDGSLSSEQAKAVGLADQVVTADEYADQWQRQRDDGRPVYSLFPDRHLKQQAHFALNPQPLKLMRRLKRDFGKVNDCRAEVLKLRTIKSADEIAAIEDAIAVTGAAFQRIVTDHAAYRHEYEIEADMTQAIRSAGARGHAYSPIVASGGNACTLHYVANNQPLEDGQPILIDIGARGAQGYAADITRTYCWRPNDRQRQVHQAVLEAQTACIALIAPGLSFDDYQTQTDAIMRSAVASLGLDVADWRHYFPHAIGHGLGVDVHDPLAGYARLEPGMVMTVEPGIYIPEEAIGVRIEDDILVTDDGNRNLSGHLSSAIDKV